MFGQRLPASMDWYFAERRVGAREMDQALKILELKDGTFDELKLKKQYIELAKQHHPDSNKSKNKEVFQKISEAYQ